MMDQAFLLDWPSLIDGRDSFAEPRSACSPASVVAAFAAAVVVGRTQENLGESRIGFQVGMRVEGCILQTRHQ